MVPNTFEGISRVTPPDNDRSYDYAIGFLTDVKQRNSNDFISMSDALADSDVTNRGASFGMLRYRPFLWIIYCVYDVQDFINTGFAQAGYDFKQPKKIPNWVLGANVINNEVPAMTCSR